MSGREGRGGVERERVKGGGSVNVCTAKGVGKLELEPATKCSAKSGLSQRYEDEIKSCRSPELSNKE